MCVCVLKALEQKRVPTGNHLSLSKALSDLSVSAMILGLGASQMDLRQSTPFSSFASLGTSEGRSVSRFSCWEAEIKSPAQVRSKVNPVCLLVNGGGLCGLNYQMRSFPRAAIANYHQLGGLSQHTSSLSQSWRLHSLWRL